MFCAECEAIARALGEVYAEAWAVGTFTDDQRQFLEFYRNAVLLRVAR